MPRKSPSSSSKPGPIGVILTSEEVAQITAKTGQKSQFTFYPKQQEALLCPEDEVCIGGAKAGGKTITGIAFLIKGSTHERECPRRPVLVDGQWMNPTGLYANVGPCTCTWTDFLKDGSPNPVSRSYIYHPKYLGCVIRRNVTDLLDWVREAKEMYRPSGGEYKEAKQMFEWPSGAIIYCGHYDDDSTWMKYQGQNIVRFLIEEATQIANFREKLQMIRSCCRSMYPEMKAQIMLTCNPGGPSHGDILDRYVEPKIRKGEMAGQLVPHGNPFVEYFKHPFQPGKKIRQTKVFIFSSIKDNPAAASNESYLASLMDMDEDMRQAYLFGNWHVLAGEYFKSFRPEGPYPGEPAEANHVISYDTAMQRLKPWFWRTSAMDWGYGHECVILVGAHDQDRDQFLVEQEMVFSQTEPDVVGEEFARRIKPTLERFQQMRQDPMIQMGLSHDAYGLRQDDRSIAEMISIGIGRILGPNMVHLPDLEVAKLEARMKADGQSTGSTGADEIFAKIRSQQRMGVTIRRMRDNRIVGWQLIRAMLRWKSSLPEIKDIFDPNLASRIAYDRGIDAYNSYLKLFQRKKEILPKILIVGEPRDSTGRIIPKTGLGCPRLIQAIPKAVRDDTNPEDVTKRHVQGASDFWDAWRYLVITFRNQSMPEPFQATVQRRIEEVRAVNPLVDTNDLIWLNRDLEMKRDQAKKGSPIHVIRSGSRMRAVAKGLLPSPGR